MHLASSLLDAHLFVQIGPIVLPLDVQAMSAITRERRADSSQLFVSIQRQSRRGSANEQLERRIASPTM